MISASGVAKIAGVSFWCLAQIIFLMVNNEVISKPSYCSWLEPLGGLSTDSIVLGTADLHCSLIQYKKFECFMDKN
jgi:hypothetical protein